MGSEVNVWNIGDSITAELFVRDPTNGTGLSGQVNFITLTIRRDSDGKYWANTKWVSSRTELQVFEVDATNQPGRYSFTLPSSANTKADRYSMFFKIDNAPLIEGEDIDIHVSRQQDVKVYESEPS